MPRHSVLIVEDEDDVRELVEYNLVNEGFLVTHVSSGEAALEVVDQKHFDLVVLDLMLPGLDGLSVCQRLRNSPNTRNTPIVMVTAKNEETDVLAGLNLGADDYITKPFSTKVLVARIRAVLRRAPPPQADKAPADQVRDVVEIHQVLIDPVRRCVAVGGKPVELTATEFDLLNLLAGQPGRVFTRRQIIDSLHGVGFPTTDRAVDVQIVGLRRKLGSAGQYVDTVRGVGYRFRE
jgi:two-component system alkaline phosphatase synthesis response regulator PhoP